MGEDELTLNWHGCIAAKKKIFFEEYFKRDVAGRKENVRPAKAKSLREEVMTAIEVGLGQLKEELTVRLDKHLERIVMIETCVNDLMSWRAKTVSEKEAAGEGFAGAGAEDSARAAAEGNENVSGEGFEDAEEDDVGDDDDDGEGVGDDEEDDEECSDLEFAQILADVKRKGKEIAQDKDNTESKKAKRG